MKRLFQVIHVRHAIKLRGLALGLQAIFLTVFFAVVAPTVQASCFKFSEKVVTPLKLPAPLEARSTTKEQINDLQNSGESPEYGNWAGVEGEVHHSIKDLLARLYDHRTVKGDSYDTMETTLRKDPAYLAIHELHLVNKPVFFLTLEWNETWAYALAKGTAENPDKIVISYEKTAGTSYIDKLCGNIVLTKKGDNSTDVLVYEELKASKRSREDTLNGVIGTLETLRR